MPQRRALLKDKALRIRYIKLGECAELVQQRAVKLCPPNIITSIFTFFIRYFKRHQGDLRKRRKQSP